VSGPGRGGPYVGITPNPFTDAIVREGTKAVPFILDRLETSDLGETIFLVFCLRELRAKEAKTAIGRLQRSERFAGQRKDLTLDMQIQFYLRDVDSW
jgi:hypothetical protein